MSLTNEFGLKKRQKIDDEKVFILILPIPMPVCGYLPSIQQGKRPAALLIFILLTVV